MHTSCLAVGRRTIPLTVGLALLLADRPGCASPGVRVGSRREPPGWPAVLVEPATRAWPALMRSAAAAGARAASAFGRETAARLGKLLRGLSGDTLRILAGCDDPAGCLRNLACMLEYVPDIGIVRRILNNRCLRARESRIPNLLADFASSDLTFANADTILGALAGASATAVYGRCFEVRAAAHLKQRHGVIVRACDKILGSANFDLLDAEGVLYQCKAYCEKSYECRYWKLRGWCEAALRRTADPAKVKWVVPRRKWIHVRFLAYLRRAGIEVLEVPFGW